MIIEIAEFLTIKESCDLIGQKTQMTTTKESGSLRCSILLVTNSMQKSYDITSFFPEILMIN